MVVIEPLKIPVAGNTTAGFTLIVLATSYVHIVAGIVPKLTVGKIWIVTVEVAVALHVFESV